MKRADNQTAETEPITNANELDRLDSFGDSVSANKASYVLGIARLIHVGLDVRQNLVRRLSCRKPSIVRNLRDLRSNVGRDLADSGQRRVQATPIEIRLAHELRERVRSTHEHFVRETLGVASDRAQPNPGEDVGVIALAWHEGLAVQLHRVVWTSTREQRAPARVAVRLFGSAFRLRGRVGEREE